ncbi:hypothetical protein [Lacticaseibacillus salsurivasis]|uniref:hypothetical protein n=1 Tax=Lacticaseibacillus salsurivasis TaxID=3081441 RepID=UPI0030C779E1
MKQTKKVQVFRAGLYQTVEVIGKYGKKLELPNQYTVVVIPNDFRQARRQLSHRKGRLHATNHACSTARAYPAGGR